MVLTLVNSLTEGMVIARPVVINGRTLLTAGSTLSAKHMQILKAWGVNDVWVEGSSGEYTDAIDINNESFSEIREKIDHRFSRCSTDEITQELKRIITIRECVKLKMQEKISEGN